METSTHVTAAVLINGNKYMATERCGDQQKGSTVMSDNQYSRNLKKTNVLYLTPSPSPSSSRPPYVPPTQHFTSTLHLSIQLYSVPSKCMYVSVRINYVNIFMWKLTNTHAIIEYRPCCMRNLVMKTQRKFSSVNKRDIIYTTAWCAVWFTAQVVLFSDNHYHTHTHSHTYTTLVCVCVCV